MPPETGNPLMKFEPVKLFPSWKYLNSNLTEFSLRKGGSGYNKKCLKNTWNKNMQIKIHNCEKN